MKTSILTAALLAATSLTSVYAQKNPAPPAPPLPPSTTLAERGSRAKPEMEKVNYLGVSTMPVSATLTEQLGLQKDIGLVVNFVVPDSPAAGVLKTHDILTKFNDQILIETRQLGVLVKAAKENEEVTITYIRGGKEGTTKVKLTQRDMPKESAMRHSGNSRALSMMGPGGVMQTWHDDSGPDLARRMEEARERAEEAIERSNEARASADRMGQVADEVRVRRLSRQNPEKRMVSLAGPDGSTRVTIVNNGDGDLMLNDKEGSMLLTSDHGKKSVVMKDLEGKVLFTGPVNTPEEKKAIPEALRARFENLENMTGLDLKPDSDLKPADVRAIPNPRAISLPLPVVVPVPPESPTL